MNVAYAQVSGMEIGLTLSLKNQQGSLALSLVENKCSVKGISINLDGGASWLYQGYYFAFFCFKRSNSHLPLSLLSSACMF